jgi:hypothetical protein
MKKLILCITLLISVNVKSQYFIAGTHYSNYSDVSPDTLLNYVNYPFTNETYTVNVFGNGPEFQLTARGSVSSGGSQAFIRIETLYQDVYVRFGRWDSVYVPATLNYNVTKIAKPLLAGDTINSANAVWMQGDLYLTDHTGSGGGNKNVNDFIGGIKFIGLKFIDTDHYNATSYGWIRVNCISKDSCYVTEYSRGASATGLTEQKLSDHLQVYPNPMCSTFYIRAVDTRNIELTSLRITDLCGQEVAFTARPVANGIQVLLNENLPSGCYFLQMKESGKTNTKKITKM